MSSKDSYHNRSDKYFSDSIHTKFDDIVLRIDALQRAVAGVCGGGQTSNFKAEYREDITEVKRLLHFLRKNKAWISREGGIC